MREKLIYDYNIPDRTLTKLVEVVVVEINIQFYIQEILQR